MPQLSSGGLARLHEALANHVASGAVPGLVAGVSRRGETHVLVLGAQSLGGPPMRRDSIFRIASMTKPIAAAAVMILVEDCVLRLDDPVDGLLPELASRRVLRALESPVDDTVPARRPITLRDLLTFRSGHGLLMAPRGTYPIQGAIESAGLSPGPDSLPMTPDEFMKRIGSLPLVAQPGERWLYHTGSEVLGVLVARASGQSFGAFLAERIFEPLGMADTGFWVPAEKLGRLTSSYTGGARANSLEPADDARASRYAAPPRFESGGGGLVSTVDDYLAFLRMMLAHGSGNGRRILSRASVELMTRNHLSPAQRAAAPFFFGEGAGWGFGMRVFMERSDVWASPGRFGWDGGRGTTGHADPAEGLADVLLTQRHMESPLAPRTFTDFWTSTYRALDD